MAQAIQEYIESRRTARMTHEPQVNPDEIVLRSFLGPAALTKRIENQRVQLQAQRDSHESDQKVHMQEQLRLQQQLEARYRPGGGAAASSPGKHSQGGGGEGTAASSSPPAPPSVSQQQKDLVDKYRLQIDQEQQARTTASRVGPFLRLRPSAETDRKAALRATSSSSAQSPSHHGNSALHGTMKGSLAKKATSRLDATGRGFASPSGGRASPLSVTGQQQAVPTNDNNTSSRGPRYVIQTGQGGFYPVRPSASSAPVAPLSSVDNTTTTTTTNPVSSSPGGPPVSIASPPTTADDIRTTPSATMKPPSLSVDALTPQRSAGGDVVAESSSPHSLYPPAATRHIPPPLFANPSSLIRDEVAMRSIHKGPIASISSSPPRLHTAGAATSGGRRRGGGNTALYDDDSIRPHTAFADNTTRQSPPQQSNSPSGGGRGGSGGLPQIGEGSSSNSTTLRHVPLGLQPLVVDVGSDPRRYVTPAPVSRWYPSLQTRLAEKAALELLANPPAPAEPEAATIVNGDTPPLPVTAAVEAPKKKKKKTPADTSVVSAQSLAPTIGSALELNVQTSLFDLSLITKVNSHRDKIWEVATQFQQPPPPPVVKKKKKASVSGPGAKRMSSYGNAAAAAPKKKKKGPTGPPPDPTTTIHSNLKGLFSHLRVHTDSQGRLSSHKFSLVLRDLGINDLTHINSVFLHLESKSRYPGFVQLGSAMAAFHQLLNGESTRCLIADVCFDLFDLDDRGYIHKAHLDCMRYLRTGLDGGTVPGVDTGNNNNNNTTTMATPASTPQEYTSTPAEVEEALRVSTRKCARKVVIEEEEKRNAAGVLKGRKRPPPSDSLARQIPEVEVASSADQNISTRPPQHQPSTSFNTTPSTGGGVGSSSNPSLNILNNNVNVINPDTHPPGAHPLCTPLMVKVLQDLFIEIRRLEEEEYIARVIRKGKKGKASKKKLPVLPDTQNSYIPTTNMRVSHISREMFRTHFSLSPSLVLVFARRWLLLLAVGDQELTVLDDGTLLAAGGGENNNNTDDDDGDGASSSLHLVSIADVAQAAVDRFENPPAFPPRGPNTD